MSTSAPARSTNNPSTAGLAVHYCEEALRKWEPRIHHIKASAAPSANEPSRLDIRVSYVIRGTNMPGNMVYPFYLQKSELGE